MEDLFNHWAIRNPALKITINCPDEVDALEQKINIQVFRIVQECLTNIVRHAQASQAIISLEIVRLSTTGKALRLRVTDDGQGCAADKIKTGFGLLGMRERLNSLDGELTIQTKPEQGMCIIANIPLK
jgi:two-component system sensor histidine kinase UhpB